MEYRWSTETVGIISVNFMLQLQLIESKRETRTDVVVLVVLLAGSPSTPFYEPPLRLYHGFDPRRGVISDRKHRFGSSRVTSSELQDGSVRGEADGRQQAERG
ncbi:unnamed protein product [Xylocopa violacea]|uniref:Uncharacterized protein n=1 Tax=Xylocopa violacea TaxID=135666 RepID=A0ABP1NAY6_XYLVO